MSKEMLNALDALEAEKGISKEIVIDALEAALVSAYKRHYGQAQNVEVDFDQKKGKIHVYAVKEVTEEVMDSQLEVSLKDALLINPAYEIGDKIRFEVTPKDFGRIAAQTAKQVILQRVREAERTIIYNEFSAYEKDIMQGIVERQDRRYIYVNLGKIEAVLSKQDQMPNEFYQPHDRIKVYVSRVENTSKGPQVFVSRSHPDLLRRLFEQEVPEVYDGLVEIVSVAREAGDRSKVAVRSTDPNIDAVGTCVGPKGQRVQAIVNELKGENMDIVEWDEDPAIFIANALNPSQVVDVIFDEKNPKACTVVVPDYQLSLAIGKRGQNARLAAKLTNHKIDIKPESEMAEYYEKQAEKQAQAEIVDEEIHDEAIIQSDLTDDEYATIAFNDENHTDSDQEI
ncbi:transcription termination factor NusA [Enterococcus sp. 10A9_DIV0425]|uniref:Transcription termination/antitermination protein NusA n=1 Tax=Candidatus Enterococcus wittei TaxID=1987383 RepID=A0A2C9XQ10_9ENTE|nr:transcription termination factor NusA [Enterococcus sp. 10A9_DIV0425]OTP12283.1 transcription termination factor NusA [Enterococcus sp. 10A9_DIV0425]THE13215.1 transcription termination/antitermination protein NusA [Enterococcus hirae]